MRPVASSNLRAVIWIVFLIALVWVIRGPVWAYLTESGLDTSRALFVAAAAGLGAVWSMRWLMDQIFGPPPTDA